MRKFLLFLLSLTLMPLSLGAMDSMELVAIKPENDGTYVDWSATVINLYDGKGQNGTTVAEGSQFLIDLNSFPIKNNGDDFKELFRVDFSTRTIINTNLSISLNPFINMDDIKDILKVQFKIMTEGRLSLPDKFDVNDAKFLKGEKKEYTTTTPDTINKEKQTLPLIENASTPVQIYSNGQYGSYSSSVTVLARFSEYYTSDRWANKVFVMPLNVTLILESGE